MDLPLTEVDLVWLDGEELARSHHHAYPKFNNPFCPLFDPLRYQAYEVTKRALIQGEYYE